ncbi:hypothetical protein P885DRAFT_48206 [Corynascus similis CBS 632.67]
MEENDMEYPYCLPTFIDGIDDGEMAVRELQAESRSWRAEKYAADSNLLVLEHIDGEGRSACYNDAQIDTMLQPQRSQVRFMVLLPTPVETIVIQDEKTAMMMAKDELDTGTSGGDDDAPRMSQFATSTPGELNISRKSLLKILTKYHVAPAACSHIRGQEQVYGSRVLRDMGVTKSFEFWYAIRARAFFDKLEKDGDLKITMYIQYNIITQTTTVIIKLRSFNNLVDSLKDELLLKLSNFVKQKTTQAIASDPLAVTIMYIQATAQWYRRAARGPRDTVRKEEEKAHVGRKGEGKEAKIIRRLHFTMRNLDQDKLQLKFIIDIIRHFKSLNNRDWVFSKVDEELRRLDNHISYQVALIGDVANRAERLLSLIFNLSAQNNARWNERMARQAMRENASLKAIAILSMVFLPGAFVSGVFGTNFFAILDSNPGHFHAAEQWWVLPVTIAASTAVTFAIYYIWQRRREKKVMQAMDEEVAIGL